ncbi:hypothetical protein HHI36_023581 [Cryptolaemus montrouzieri]|uniref:Uncharacterized protein n=1 Tax=Cryptolaemus montrouzieri TaxID=559131 RepID=A0ABD2PHH1_9CUCU
MRAEFFIFVISVCAALQVDNTPWTVSNPDRISNHWLRKGKNAETTIYPSTTPNSTDVHSTIPSVKSEKKIPKFSTIKKTVVTSGTTATLTSTTLPPTPSKNTLYTGPITTSSEYVVTSENSISESTELTETTLEPRENPKPHDLYQSKEKPREKLHVKIASNISQALSFKLLDVNVGANMSWRDRVVSIVSHDILHQWYTAPMFADPLINILYACWSPSKLKLKLKFHRGPQINLVT